MIILLKRAEDVKHLGFWWEVFLLMGVSRKGLFWAQIMLQAVAMSSLYLAKFVCKVTLITLTE